MTIQSKSFSGSHKLDIIVHIIIVRNALKQIIYGA